MLYDALTEAAGDALGYDLKAKYAEFNRAYFEGRLPTIPLSFANLKSVGGVVRSKVKAPDTGKPDPRRVRLGLVRRFDGYTLVPGSMNLAISSLYLRSHESIDAILLHEMVHVWFQAVLNDFNEDHGKNFLAKIAELSKLSGIQIPVTDNVKGLELAPEKKKTPLAVLLVTKEGQPYTYGITSVKHAHEALAKEEKYWKERTAIADEPMSATFYIIASEAWSEIAAMTSVPRSKIATRGWGSAPKKDELLTDLKAHGDVLFHVGN